MGPLFPKIQNVSPLEMGMETAETAVLSHKPELQEFLQLLYKNPVTYHQDHHSELCSCLAHTEEAESESPEMGLLILSL